MGVPYRHFRFPDIIFKSLPVDYQQVAYAAGAVLFAVLVAVAVSVS